ncbi:MAG TPA: DUF819 family protein [Thermosynechococcus sp. M46_R2017_013]|nr:DUF819 family protein [Thermosynechococcus sp. M46_R2017_013]
MAIVWLLLLVNLQDVRRLGRSALLAFGIASFGTLVGALLASVLFHGQFLGDTPPLGGKFGGQLYRRQPQLCGCRACPQPSGPAF